jgi:hypothetical protein
MVWKPALGALLIALGLLSVACATSDDVVARKGATIEDVDFSGPPPQCSSGTWSGEISDYSGTAPGDPTPEDAVKTKFPSVEKVLLADQRQRSVDAAVIVNSEVYAHVTVEKYRNGWIVYFVRRCT